VGAPASWKNTTSAGPTLARGRFYGDVRQQWTSSLLTISVVAHDHPRDVPEHEHECAYFTLLLRGSYREEAGGHPIVYAPLSAVYHPPGLVHRDAIGPGGGLFLLVELAEAMLGRHDRNAAGVASVRDLSGGALVWTLLRMYWDLGGAAATPLLIEERLAGIVACLRGHVEPASAAEPAWLRRIDERVHEGFRAPIFLADLAREAGVHPVHLSRVYRQHRQRSIRESIQRLRVLDACRLMLDEDLTLADIACMTGFADQSHLSNVCRRVTTRSPALLKRLLARK
jgi:AraC family transcriptional regulator